MKNRTIWAKLANSNKPYVNIVLCNYILNLIVTFYSGSDYSNPLYISKTLINILRPNDKNDWFQRLSFKNGVKICESLYSIFALKLEVK